jgi:hypothetical protein
MLTDGCSRGGCWAWGFDIASDGTVAHTGDPDVNHIIKDATDALVESVEAALAQDEDDARQTGNAAPSPDARAACLRLSRHLAPHVAFAPRLKWAAFTEEDGGISLVAQSLVTDRRINCRIRADGSAITAVRIDEHMQTETFPVLLANPDIGRELAEWVTTRL